MKRDNQYVNDDSVLTACTEPVC
ncbi:uncharacterized protein METZ01_LOCUS131166 [marine metagenome]|uniref:Uncharacterized protein n=1 Tax=marine metagenome TaxID=408172 RepID=A0A381YNW4_9ZZZZ